MLPFAGMVVLSEEPCAGVAATRRVLPAANGIQVAAKMRIMIIERGWCFPVGVENGFAKWTTLQSEIWRLSSCSHLRRSALGEESNQTWPDHSAEIRILALNVQ
jgi:hypothetical protein